MFLNCTQFEKAAAPMAVTVVGIRTTLIKEQFSNAEAGKVFTSEGIVMNELFPQDAQSMHSSNLSSCTSEWVFVPKQQVTLYTNVIQIIEGTAVKKRISVF